MSLYVCWFFLLLLFHCSALLNTDCCFSLSLLFSYFFASYNGFHMWTCIFFIFHFLTSCRVFVFYFGFCFLFALWQKQHALYPVPTTLVARGTAIRFVIRNSVCSIGLSATVLRVACAHVRCSLHTVYDENVPFSSFIRGKWCSLARWSVFICFGSSLRMKRWARAKRVIKAAPKRKAEAVVPIALKLIRQQMVHRRARQAGKPMLLTIMVPPAPPLLTLPRELHWHQRWWWQRRKRRQWRWRQRPRRRRWRPTAKRRRKSSRNPNSLPFYCRIASFVSRVSPRTSCCCAMVATGVIIPIASNHAWIRSLTVIGKWKTTYEI